LGRVEAGSKVDESDLRRRARGVLWTSVPLALGAAVYQINVMVDGFMAEAFLADGGPSAHYLANRVQQFPLALIALAATSAVFPSLKALGHRGRLDELRALHDKAQLGVCFLALPASVGLFLFAEPIARALFEHGSYGPAGVARVAAALKMLALALLPAGAVGLASRTYYARGDFKTPVRVSIGVLIANAGLNAVFLVGFDMDVEGLALATALSSWAQLAILLPGLSRALGLPRSSARAPGRVARMLVASAASGAAAWGAYAALVGWDPAAGTGRTALGLGAAAAAGIGCYLAAATALRLPVERFGPWLAERGVALLVDGAHAPGQIPLALAESGASFVTGNAHKWLCAPKGAAYLWVEERWQERVRPPVISHSANSTRTDRSGFLQAFDWAGTQDPTAWLCIAASLDFLSGLYPGGLDEHMRRNHALALEMRDVLCAALDIAPPAPDELLGSMAALPLPPDPQPSSRGALQPDRLQQAVYARCRVEAPVMNWPAHPARVIRVSAQAYTTLDDARVLAAALTDLLAEEPR